MPAEAGASLARPEFTCPLLEGPTCAPYAVQGMLPPLVLLPESEDAAARAIAACAAAGLAVVPWGGGTLQALGYPPERLDAVLSMERLDGIVQYEPADLTISVQAGCTIEQVSAALGANGQLLPFDAADPRRATVGGAIAANQAGPRRFGGGSFRDLLIGITVAAPDGTISKGGGMVVKNVSGYDMMKLHLGALGTLGLIVRLNFKVLTRPAAEATAVIAGERAALVALAAELASSQLTLDSLELVGPGVPRAADAGWRLAARLTGSAGGVGRKRDEVARLAAGRGLAVEWSEGAPMQAWWQACVRFLAPGDAGPREALLRLAALPAGLGPLVEQVERLCAGAGLTARLAAHAGNGVLFARVGDGHRPIAQALPELHAALLARWGDATVLAGPPELKPRLDVWGRPPAGLALMRAIKAQFDPRGTLNPGRFIGRL